MAEDKGSAATKRSAATGAAPVSDEKAADTAEAYEQVTGQTDQPVSDSDPVIDSINEATKDVEQPESQAALINPEYEKQRAEAFRNRKTSEDEEDDEPENVPDADYPEVGSHLVEAEESGEQKPAAKSTAKK